jgi:HPr kinase/phosphorylase
MDLSLAHDSCFGFLLLMPAERLHATAVKLGPFGVLLLGPAGSGKSSLALDLLFLAREAGWECGLVGDDVIMVDVIDGQLVAKGHDAIAGAIELRGLGIGAIAPVPACVLTHVVRLDGQFHRQPENPQITVWICREVPLPCWHVSDPRRVASALLLLLRQDLTLMKQ